MEGWESKNSLCINYSCSWILKTFNDFRRCERDKYGAVERFVNGKWVSVAQRVIREKKKQISSVVPVSLF